MKTMTTLTAVAALIAGMSFASAQMSPSPSTGAGGQATRQQVRFCSTVSKTNGSLNCKYASMAACEKDAQAQGLQCSPNPSAATTGSKN